MNYSGILIKVKPQNILNVSQALNALEGVEVFQEEPETGRIVAVLEAESIKAETEQLRSFHALATSIEKNSKGGTLLTALRRGLIWGLRPDPTPETP